MNVFPAFSQEAFAHRSAWPEKSKRWDFLKQSRLSPLLFIDNVVLCASLHSLWEKGGGKVSTLVNDCVWVISNTTQGPWLWLVTKIPSGNMLFDTEFCSFETQNIRKIL